jgi:uncharacterized protein
MLRPLLVLSYLSLALAAPLSAQEPDHSHEGHQHAPPAPAEPVPTGILLEKALVPVPFEKVRIKDNFFRPRIETNRKVTLEAIWKQSEESGRIRNFEIAAGTAQGKFEGLRFNDSDVYKLIEAAAYSLHVTPDAALEARVDQLVDKIAAAQREDGYLNTYYQVAEPDKRWTDIRHGHELYCAGHLIEAALAYKAATGKEKLVAVARKLADHIDATFGPGKKSSPSGHPEIELALVKLHRATGEARYLKLAQFLLDQRGNHAGRESFGEYAQDHKPVREQTEIAGHAVRATYLYSGMADVLAATGDKTLFEPLKAIWNDVVTRRMYITGGIGDSASNEGFTKPFELPNDSAYCETCASIGMAMWNQRMLHLTGDPQYADIVERELFNAIAASVSLAGDRFFYDNPLASRGEDERVPWFKCACCPANVARFLASMPGTIYAVGGNTLYVTQLVASSTTVDIAGTQVTLEIVSDYPESGRMTFKVNTDRPATFNIKVRRPGWCKEAFVQHDLKEQEHPIDCSNPLGAWESFERQYEPNDGFTVHFLAPLRREKADERIAANRGRVALARGPLVYCFEGADNAGSARSIVLPPTAELKTIDWTNGLPRTRAIRAKAQRVERDAFGNRTLKPADVTAVPYAVWNNRGKGEMTVWVAEDPKLAEIKGEGPSLDQDGVLIQASHVADGDSLAALSDKKLPSASNDATIPRQTFWSHKGTAEWLGYEFPSKKKLSKSAVYWFDDTGKGECKVPASWRLTWKDGAEWKPVTLKSGQSFGVAPNTLNTVEFEPIDASRVRLEVQLQPDASAGVLEWQLE